MTSYCKSIVGTFSGWVTATVSRMPINRLTTWGEEGGQERRRLKYDSGTWFKYFVFLGSWISQPSMSASIKLLNHGWDGQDYSEPFITAFCRGCFIIVRECSREEEPFRGPPAFEHRWSAQRDWIRVIQCVIEKHIAQDKKWHMMAWTKVSCSIKNCLVRWFFQWRTSFWDESQPRMLLTKLNI